MNSTNMDNNLTADLTPLRNFASWFSNIHGYSSVIVCIFGICTNVFNVTILTRKDMSTPTNIILTWLAISDLLTMIPYVPFAIHFYCIRSIDKLSPETHTYRWMVFMLFLINFTATTHTVSIWLGVALAVFRCVQMQSTSKGPLVKKRRMLQVKVTTAVVYVGSVFILIPNYLTNDIVAHRLDTNDTYYLPKDLNLASASTEKFVLFNVLLYAITTKLVPCTLMVVFGGWLLCNLTMQGKKRRRRLSTTSLSNKKASHHARTTRMLLVVMILFLITELPQGVLIITSTFVPGFYKTVYMALGDMMDFLALMNNAINFVLYCIMSQQFRQKFLVMYLRKNVSSRDFERLNGIESTTLSTNL